MTNTMNNEALKPCPFCGHTGLDFREGSTFRWLLPECGGCGASCGEVRVQTVGEGSPQEWLEAAKAEAISDWNTRAAQAEQPAPQAQPVASERDNMMPLAVQDAEPCPHDGSCKNRRQCWEPCGDLGHSEKHIRVAPKETQDAVNAALGLAEKPETQGELVLAELDALGDDAAVHIWLDDLDKCSRSECAVQVYSVRMGGPDGKTVPLFSREQVAAALLSAPPAPSTNREST